MCLDVHFCFSLSYCLLGCKLYSFLYPFIWFVFPHPNTAALYNKLNVGKSIPLVMWARVAEWWEEWMASGPWTAPAYSINCTCIACPQPLRTSHIGPPRSMNCQRFHNDCVLTLYNHCSIRAFYGPSLKARTKSWRVCSFTSRGEHEWKDGFPSYQTAQIQSSRPEAMLLNQVLDIWHPLKLLQPVTKNTFKDSLCRKIIKQTVKNHSGEKKIYIFKKRKQFLALNLQVFTYPLRNYAYVSRGNRGERKLAILLFFWWRIFITALTMHLSVFYVAAWKINSLPW